MKGRPAFSQALVAAVLAAGTTVAALMSWRGFVADSSAYLVPALVIGLVLGTAGALLRWLNAPRVLTFTAQVVLAVGLVSAYLGGGPVPVGEPGARMADALRDAVDSARTYAAPVPLDVPSVAPLLLVGGVLFLLVVDLLACTLHRVPVAGLALLAVYSVPAGLVESGPGWLTFVLAAAGFLALLHLDSRERVLRWGRPLGPDEHDPWTDSNPISDALRVGAGRIGVAATALALVVPPLIPVLDINLLGIGPGDGDDDIQIRNPRTDLRRDLEEPEDVPLLRVRTDDPDPRYLRIAALNRFTGIEWSTGNRGVADNATATGELPPPRGLSPDAPVTTYDYEVDAYDSFDSTWLPTWNPASSVTAEGDWRYDADTMDFIAVPNDLTTAGLSYELTAMEPDFGTDGRFFQDAPGGAVDDEFLDIPGGLPSAVRNYAISVTEGSTDEYEAALRLQDWFRESGGFRYSLRRAPEGIGGDVFETFLNEGPEGRVGYCEQFASAMAIMARIVGIPARVAVGFLEPERVGEDTYEYSTKDLHAWVELYFEGTGWTLFEPTPSRIADTVPDYTTVPFEQRTDNVPTGFPSDDLPNRGPTDDLTEATETVTEEVRPEDEAVAGAGGDDGGGWRAVIVGGLVTAVALALLLAVGLTPRTLRERARRRRLAGGPEDAWAELRATTLDLGIPWPAGRSPREVGGVLLEHLGDRSDENPPERPRTGPDADRDAAAALERIVDVLERSRYARPGSAGASYPGLADDVRACADSLAAGVPRRRTRARWFPRSLWTRGTGAEGRPAGPDPTPA